MMKFFVVLALVAIAAAAPVDEEKHKSPKIVKSAFDTNDDGGYSFAFETEDGINKQEDGELKEVLDEENKPHQVIVVRGSYTYTDSDGKPQTVTYYADETGFHATGDIIPKNEPVVA